MMDCNEAITYIHSLEKFGIKPGLERIEKLCSELGNPQNCLKFIHVAGTNGKGSTSTMIANVLIEAGYNVGLYTSPYVIDFRERIQLNGEMISQKDLALCVEQVKFVIENKLNPLDIQITEFEAVTAAAFYYYSLKKCDYVVLEVGLGGRYDATNIIPAPVAVCLAYIGLDHTAILGDSIEKIAAEKCGIIKKGCSVISYPYQRKDALKVIEESCINKECKLIIPDVNSFYIADRNIHGTDVKYCGINYRLKMAGDHIAKNSLVAYECCKTLGISDENIVKGLEKTTMPARMELIGNKPSIILDGGHNEDCGEALKNFVLEYKNNRKITMVSSIMADKDYDAYFSLVAPLADKFIATKASVPRALDSDKLKVEAEKYCKECYEFSNSISAINFALENTNEDDLIIICGSFYLAGEVREHLLKLIHK